MAIILSAEDETYLQTIAGPALRTQMHWGLPAAVTMAQAIVEGNGLVDGKWVWGSSPLVRLANNPFGIKYVHKIGEDYQENELTVRTPEVIDGQRQMVLQDFRRFGDLNAAFDAHAQLLWFAPRYAPAKLLARDWNAFAVAIMNCGYSTDRPELCRVFGCRHYAGELADLVTENRLDDHGVLVQWAARAIAAVKVMPGAGVS